MVYIQTRVYVADNTGAYFAKCVGIFAHGRMARVGDQLSITIKSLILNKKVAHRKKRKVFKGTVRRSVLIRAGWIKKRWGNSHFKYSSNATALIGTWNMPVGNRISGPVSFEVRITKFVKIAMLSEGAY